MLRKWIKDKLSLISNLFNAAAKLKELDERLAKLEKKFR